MRRTAVMLILFVLGSSFACFGQSRQALHPNSTAKTQAGRAESKSKTAITSAAFSPDGKKLAVGSYQMVRLLDAATGKTVLQMPGHAGAVTALAFSPKGEILAAAGGSPGKSGEIKLWNAKTGKLLTTLTGHTDILYSVAFHPDGQRLVACSYDHLVSLWNLPPTLTSLRAAETHSPSTPITPTFLRDHTDAVYAVAFSPDGQRIASAAGDRTVKVWDTATGKRLYTLNEATAELYSLAFRPDGRQLAAGGVDKTLRVWNLSPTEGVLARSAFAHDGAILRVVYSHDGRSLVTTGEDNAVKRWDADSLEERAVYPRQSDWPHSVAFSPDDHTLAVGCHDGTLTRYNVETRLPIQAMKTARKIAKARNGGEGKYCTPNENPSGVGGMNSSAKGATRRSSFGRIQSFILPSPLRRGGGGEVSVRRTGSRRLRAEELIPPSTACFPANFLSDEDKEIAQATNNDTAQKAQRIEIPSVVSGKLWNGKPDTQPALSHFYRFTARKGETLVLDVLARRLGSPLDSEIEVLDGQGKPIERAVLRGVGQTEVTLSDRDSASPGIRLLLRADFHINDYILAGRELLQIYTLPKGPDDDYVFRSYRGQRLSFLGMPVEYHSIGAPVYKVEIHPPGSVFSPNGMPLTHVFYKNDDGGPLYGRDSYLEFTPPADGEYIVRIGDVRGQQGEKYAYKLRIHSPRPDYRISLSPPAPGIPKGGSAVVTVECERYEGFDGPIAVRLEGLPPGITSTEAVIEAGETSANLLLTAAPDAQTPPMGMPGSYRLTATAEIGGKSRMQSVEPDEKARRVTIGAASNLQIVTDLRDVVLHPGRETTVEARINRMNGFKGRVPLDVRNLPFGVRVVDVGLNGVLITEQDTARKFTLYCEPWVKPQSRLFYVTANVEGGVSNTALPLTLHIETAHVSAR